MGPCTECTRGFLQFMLNCLPAVTVLQHKPLSLWQSFLLSSSDDIPSMFFLSFVWSWQSGNSSNVLLLWSIHFEICLVWDAPLSPRPSRRYWTVSVDNLSAWTNLVNLLSPLLASLCIRLARGAALIKPKPLRLSKRSRMVFMLELERLGI